MANMPSFVKVENDKVIFNGGPNKEMVAYIPEKYFSSGNIAEIDGKYTNIIGIFNYTVQDINTGKNIGLRTFKLPTLMSTKPGEVEKVKNIKLISDSKPMDYRIYRYRDGDIIINETKVVQFIGNCEKFLNLFFVLGFIINTIPYDKIQNYIIDNGDLNGFSYGVNIQMFGFIISEVCRSMKDQNIPYRLSGEKDLHAYSTMSVKNISKLTSPYTAIISDEFDNSILHAMLNETPKDTPLEKVLVGENNDQGN